MFRTINSKFYLIAVLLLLLFGIGYTEVAIFLDRQAKGVQRGLGASAIDIEIQALKGTFWEVRFWEKAVLAQKHPEADKRFGELMHVTRKRIEELSLGSFSSVLAEPVARISLLLSEYETSFTRLMQLKTEQRMNQTDFAANEQALVSSVLMGGEMGLMKPLFNLARFHGSYLQHHRDSEYQALGAVLDSMAARLSDSSAGDGRVKTYLTKYRNHLDRDFALENELDVINRRFDTLSIELSDLFTSISRKTGGLSMAEAQSVADMRNLLNKSLFISAVCGVAMLFLILRILARKLVNPIKAISSVVSQVQAGNLDARFVSRDRDDITDLGLTFNSMLDTIKRNNQHLVSYKLDLERKIRELANSEEELRKHRDHLGELVDERTAELGAAIKELKLEMAERAQAEKALRESREVYRTLIETIPYGVQEVDLSGWIIFTNPAHDAIFGYSHAEMLGMNTIDLVIEGADRGLLRQFFTSGAAQQPPPSTRMFRSATKDGRVIDLQVDWNYKRNELGTVVGFISVITDVSERRKLEARLRQAQKMEAIGTLAGGIAHDFNNILTPIIGYTELALARMGSAEHAQRDLHQVLKAAQRAKDLVNQILAVSRHDREQERTAGDVSTIVEEALKLLRALIPSTIEVRQNLDPGIALVDATQIHQVLINLCTNASHAMNGTGVLDVSLTGVQIGNPGSAHIPDLDPGSYLRLRVADTGPGMDAATLERIFDPYFTTKAVGKGSGLGLAVVHGIVKRHRGAVTVRSRLGQGSIFDVYIPKIEDLPKEAADVSRELPTGTERILLVDDEQIVVDVGTGMLEELGYRVEAVTDSEQALKTFRARPEDFDLIITDYTMPNLTGTGLVREVFKTRADMPVILCTGFSEQVTEEMAKSMGIMEFAMKPLDWTRLAQMVRRVLDAQKDS
ncbi:hybrid sensor histidine kinase/response regulator [Syntrophobacter fumaroxidans]|uniref:histidine kinase n=1 Tax=Syntrophobacter fumaroxidans (strain DSM 10017 / MPOB) TaxID=335543 RepID=A0LHI3_SYNFM|nr:PAS domain S-box protein [Syntrophobacter fumaroxidans]ABK16885.1 PAS/PAC sensor hybrid histidine kinase [Syntrophobacter fumaroxidans MPOB]